MSKFPASKLLALACSGAAFLLLWGVIASTAWSGAPSKPAPVNWFAPPRRAEQPAPVIVRETIVVRRIHVLATDQTGAPPARASEPPAQEPVAAAPPPQPQPPTQQGSPAPVPQPVTITRGS